MTHCRPANAAPSGRRRLVPALALLGAALAALPAAATQLVPANLTRLIGQSDLIVSGKVESVTDGLDAKGVPYTEVTIAVGASAKKKLAARSDFKFRQYGLLRARKMPDGRFLVAKAPEGFPSWTKDEQVVAFMYKPAAKTGLRTTVGLAQGKFTASGGRLANEQHNQGLFTGVQVNPGLLTSSEAAMLRSPAGAVDTVTLMSLVNRAVAGQWIEKGAMR
jgi:hypothetical protein